MENNLKRRTSKTTRPRQLTTLTTTVETGSPAASRQTTSYTERRTRSASTAPRPSSTLAGRPTKKLTASRNDSVAPQDSDPIKTLKNTKDSSNTKSIEPIKVAGPAKAGEPLQSIASPAAVVSSAVTEPIKAGERVTVTPRSATELTAEEIPAEDRAAEDRAAEEVPHGISTPARSSAGTRLAAGTRSPATPQPRSELVTASAASRLSTSAVKREREPMTLAGLLKLLADDHRLAIIELLKSQPELNVGEFCEMLSQSQPAVSHHLAQLRRAGLLESRRSGKHRFYRIRRRGWREVEMLLSGLLFDANCSLRRPVPSLVGAD